MGAMNALLRSAVILCALLLPGLPAVAENTAPRRETGARAAQGERYTGWAQREAVQHADFPTGREMAELARRSVAEVTPAVLRQTADDKLLAWLEAEYAIFRAIEQRVCDAQVHQKFANVEEFLDAAATIMNRRKSRAGHSLEHHVEFLLRESGIAFEAQATIDGKVRPDVLLPGKAAYDDAKHPAEKLAVLALKTTCKDRWRQILNEGKRVTVKDLLTLQPAMSHAQLAEMHEAKVRLTVPAPLHDGYKVPDGVQILTVSELIADLRRRFPQPASSR